MPTRPALVLLALSTAVLTACSAGADPAAAPDPVVPSPTAAPSAPTQPVAPPSAPPSPTARVITASFTGGDVVVDSPRVETSLNEEVVLRISSDVAEEIHVHGYDVYADVPAGGSVDIPLTLTLPGAYEVELHSARRPLFQLRTA